MNHHLLFVGVVLMLLGVGIWAMRTYSICPPGANCGTNNPSINLVVNAVIFFAGLALVVVSMLYPSSPRLPK